MTEMIQSAYSDEEARLERTITIAKEQLERLKGRNEANKIAIMEAKKEMRENTRHGGANLWSSDGFEALAAMNQYANPINDKLMDYEEVENKKAILEKMILSPYFARIDFKFDEEDEFEEIYIGRTSLMEDDVSDIYVYDWRSPIASVFYRFMNGEAYYDAPGGRMRGELGLKRQYEISNGKLDYFFDAEVQVIDEFLRKMLSQNASPQMKTIVETIQKEQDVVIRDMDTDLMMVQGVAGSGKTSIALHRAAYLMYQGLSAKLTAENILIISPNTVFEQYIASVLPELGENNVSSAVFEDILRSMLKNRHIQTRIQFLEELISAAAYRRLIKRSMEFKTSELFKQIMERLIDELPHRWVNFEDITYEGMHIVSKAWLKSKVMNGREVTPLGIRLRMLEDHIYALIKEAKKERIHDEEEVQIRAMIRKHTAVDIVAIYRKLFADKNYFYKLADGLVLPDDIEDLIRFTQENLYGSLLHYDDATAMAWLHLKVHGMKKYKQIKQVVIDEAQDYYPLHFEIFNLMFPNAKFTILGDVNQTLEKNEDLSQYDQIRKIFKREKNTLVTLNKSFRCTNEILNFSLKFLERGAEIKSFNRSGDQPKLYAVKEQTVFIKNILEEVDHCRQKGYQSIGLLCKNERNAVSLYGQLKNSLDVKLIKNEETADLQGVFIIPVYMSKGLEFDAVLICDADNKTYKSREDKNLLYIACTRALHRLNLFCKGTASALCRSYEGEQ